MDLEPEQIASKARVGRIGAAPVFQLVTHGGLHLIVAARGAGFETLGIGPHRAVARFIAQKKSDDKIEFTDLSKSDHVDIAHFSFCLPRYEAMTDAMRKRQGL